MPRSVFVSYVFEDKPYFDQVRSWGASVLLGDDIVVIGEARDVRQDGDSAVRQHLQSRIQGAFAVLVLVGNNTHNHSWVQYELSFATSAHKPTLAMRIPGTTGLAPEGFRHLQLVPFDPSSLRKALAALV